MSRSVKIPGANARLTKKVERLEGEIDALTTAINELAGRVDKLEVVRVPSATMEPDPQEPQRPETE